MPTQLFLISLCSLTHTHSPILSVRPNFPRVLLADGGPTVIPSPSPTAPTQFYTHRLRHHPESHPAPTPSPTHGIVYLSHTTTTPPPHPPYPPTPGPAAATGRGCRGALRSAGVDPPRHSSETSAGAQRGDAALRQPPRPRRAARVTVSPCRHPPHFSLAHVTLYTDLPPPALFFCLDGHPTSLCRPHYREPNSQLYT